MKRPITNAVVDRVVEGVKSSISPLHSQGQHWEARGEASLPRSDVNLTVALWPIFTLFLFFDKFGTIIARIAGHER